MTSGYTAVYIPPVAPHHLSQAAENSRSKSTSHIEMPSAPYNNPTPALSQANLNPSSNISPNTLPAQQSGPQVQMPAAPYQNPTPGAIGQPDLNNTSYQPYRTEDHVSTNTPMAMPIPQAPAQTGLAQEYYNTNDAALPVPQVQVNSASISCENLPDGPAGDRGLFSSSANSNSSSKSKKYMDKSAKFIGKQIEKQIQKKMNKSGGGGGGAGSEFSHAMQEQFGGGHGGQGDGQQYGEAAGQQDYSAAGQDYGAGAQDYGAGAGDYGYGAAGDYGGGEGYGYPEGCGFDSAEVGEAFSGLGEAAGGLGEILGSIDI